MDMKLEVVVVPVADVDRAKAFYTGLGWRLDADVRPNDDFRVVQVTPPGSSTSVIFGKSVTSQGPGSAQGLHLIVSDIDSARAELKRLDADPSEVFHDAGGVFHHAGVEGRVPGADPERRSYGSFLSFSDPDGNGWVLQEVTTRLPGRIDPSATVFASVQDLAAALRRAQAANRAPKGEQDANWADRYADFLVREQAGESSK
ncbi:VOC family protein [Streptomyces sp. NPDC048295]|uniref:VOC family protein n=1 Tax=Streptomyces sp. NPDC048295 TaxID=3154617 RepID=UPI00343B3213